VAPGHSAPLVKVAYQVGGDEADWPVYPKFFVRTRNDPADEQPWTEWTARSFDEFGRFELELPQGATYELSSELQPSAAMRSVFWMLDREGRFPDADARLTLELPPRSRVRLLAGSAPHGVDVVTLFQESTGTFAWALNDPTKALFTGFALGADTDSYQRRAENRPFTTAEFRPGPYVIAARVNGHQWMARRAELTPGGTLELPTHLQPTGGGTVVCENGQAVLLLHGEFPIPMPYRRVDFRLRCQWEGVPPGRHALRYPDGTEVSIDVTDGARIDLPKQPAR
jgi:hypothetical protein